MATRAEEMLRDPEFHALPGQDRRAILSQFDLDFAGLPENDQISILERFRSGGEIERLARGEFVERPPLPAFTRPGALPDLPELPTEARKPSGLETAYQVATTPASKAMGGATLTEVYDMATDAMTDVVSKALAVRKATLKKDFPAVVFVNKLIHGLPELADFFQSPAGVLTYKLQAAKPVVRAFVNAAFATDMGAAAKEALTEAWRKPSAETLGEAAKSSMIALLPWIHAAGTEVKTRQMVKQQARATVEKVEELPAKLPKKPGPRLSREQRRALSMPPEEGLPEGVARGVDARENLAGRIFEKPFKELSNPDRMAIDELVGQGYGKAVQPLAERAIPRAQKPPGLPEVPRKGKMPTEEPPAPRERVGAPKPPPPEAAAKEPWQMTLEEYSARFAEVTDKAKLRGAHEHLVVQAARDRKALPEAVLEGYPRAREALKQEKPPEKAPLELQIVGEQGTAYTPKETAVAFQYAVSDVSELTTSFDKGYDQALQPRDISRKGSRQRVEQRKGDLNPAKMGESVNAGDGAPLTRSDGMVITRNHGIQALKELYEQGSDRGQAYKEWLGQNAERFGLDRERVEGMERPVLHRVLTAEMDRKAQVKLAQEANMPTVAQMSEAEMAEMLSKRLSGPMMEAFEVNEEGVPSPAFVRSFVSELPVEMQAGFFDEGGQLSQSGLRSIRNTIFAKAYPNTAAIERLAEATDSNVRNVSNGMLMAAPKFARLQDAVDKGDRWDLSIATEMSKAASTLSALRDQRMTVDDWLRQGDIFGRDPVEVRIIEVLTENRRSAKRIGEILKEYADTVETLGSPKQETMFGEPQLPSRLEILDAAYRRVKEKAEAEKPATLFEARPEGGGGAPRVAEEAGPPEGPEARVPKAPVERPPDAVDRLEAEARQRWEARKPEEGFLREEKGEIDPQAFADAAIIAVAKMRRGVRSFEEWSREMVRDLGERIRPRLEELYRTAQERLGLLEEIEADEYFNFRRVVISDQMKEQLRTRVVETVVRTGRFPKERESWDHIREEAKGLGPEVVKQLKPFQEAQAEYRQVRLIARELVNEQNQKMFEARQRLDRDAGSVTQEELITRERELDAMERDARGLLDVWMRMRSEDGRNLAMHRMMADDAVSATGGFDLTYWVSRAKRALGIRAGVQLPDRQLGKLRTVTAEGREAWQQAVQRVKEKPRPAEEVPAQLALLPELPGERPRGPTPEEKIERGVTRALTAVERRIERAQGVERPPSPWRLTPEEKRVVDSDPRVVAARRKLMRIMAEMDSTGFVEALAAFRKAGLLTGFKTQMRNIGGNFTFAMIEELKRVPASGLDMALSLFTQSRTVHGASPKAFSRAVYIAGTKGLREAGEILRHGTTPDQLSRIIDMPREINTNSHLLNVYINGVFRLMAAEDRVFKTVALHRSLQEQASLIAKNEGGGEARRLELYRNPTEAMQAEAMAAAEFATFNNRNFLSQWVSSGVRQFYAGGPAQKATAFGIDMVAPYRNTPSNIIARIFDYTPVGGGIRIGAETIRSIQQKALNPREQKTISDAFGRGMVGAGLIYLGYKLAEAGLMTGTREEEQPARRAVEQAAGRLPGAILVEGKWRQVAPFAPTGNLLTVGATYFRERTRELRQEAARPYRMIGVALETAMEQPFMKGISDIQQAMEAPARKLGAYAASALGSFVPTLVADFASVFDPKRRAYWEAGPIGGVVQRLPGLRQALPERRDVLGRVMSQYRSQAVDPTLAQPAKELTDQVLSALIKNEVRIGWPQRQPDEPDEQYSLRSQLIGRLIEYHVGREVGSDRYKDSLPGEPRRLLLDRAIHNARVEASRRTTQRGQYKKGSEERRVEILRDEIERANQRIPSLPPVPSTALQTTR